MPIRRVARALLAANFVATGVDTLLHPKPKVEAAKPLLDKAQTVVPAAASITPELFVKADGAVKVGAGLLMAMGRAPRLSATLLAVDLIPSTATDHPFWSKTYPDDRRAQQSQFLKNASLLGGLLLAITAPSTKPSETKAKIAERTEKTRRKGEQLSRRARRAAEKARENARKAAKKARKDARKAAKNARKDLRRAAQNVLPSS